MLLGTDLLCTNGNRLIIEDGLCFGEPKTTDESLSDMRPELKDMLKQFLECFAEKLSDIGVYKHGSMSIKLKSDKIVKKPTYCRR